MPLEINKKWRGRDDHEEDEQYEDEGEDKIEEKKKEYRRTRMKRRTMMMMMLIRKKIKERKNNTRECGCCARSNHRSRPDIVWRYWGVTVLSAVMRGESPYLGPGRSKAVLGGRRAVVIYRH